MGFEILNGAPLDEARKLARALDVARISHENVKLKAQNQALEAQNDFLSDCLVELSELVYAHEEKLKEKAGSDGKA